MNDEEVVQLLPRRLKGGGAGAYDGLIEAVYQDSRIDSELRELLLTMMWVVYKDPRRARGGAMWKRLNEIYGMTAHGAPRLALKIARDLPRYEPDRRTQAWMTQKCQAPLKTRDGLCGAATDRNRLRVDPDTGWWEPVWYCLRHQEFGESVRRASQELGKVEPVPNVGGLLPVYLRHRRGDQGWEDLYRWSAGWSKTRWKPSPYGTSANAWPNVVAVEGGEAGLRLVSPGDDRGNGER